MANLRHLVVNGVAVIVEGRGLQDDPRGPHHHGNSEDPEEQTVQHHRHVLPVLQDLDGYCIFTYTPGII